MLIVMPEEVQNATGATVSLADINAAMFTIETISGVLSDIDDQSISNTDLAWVKRAVIFQTAWAVEQSDYQSRLNATSLSQDGVSVSASDDLTFVLAPLAKRALSNCSWAKSGTLKVAAPDSSISVLDPTISDAHGGWVKL